jgi:hypothetical protein
LGAAAQTAWGERALAEGERVHTIKAKGKNQKAKTKR